MPFELEDTKQQPLFKKKAKYTIKVIGVGGAGNNAVKRMVEKGIDDVELIAANTDVQVLELNPAPYKIQLGEKLTRGLGAGGNPVQGKESAIESLEKIKEYLENTDLLFITAGFGGGTGTGAAPVIAKLATEMNILTVAIVTTPFHFEGTTRDKIASEGIKELKNNVDSLIKISNDRLIDPNENKPIDEIFAEADEVLYQAITGISNLITKPGLINVDFADVKSVLKGKGSAMLGIGYGKGENKAEEAVRKALESKILDNPVKNCTAVLVNISGKNPTVQELKTISNKLKDSAIDDANMKSGISIVDLPEDEIKVTIIASGYDRFSEENTYEDNIYEQPALYRYFGKSIVTDEISKVEKILHEEESME
ncbi:cell division protein FtsZ [Tepiditoga spiralis]|uniref:Cell division protein FtsZ n=1 Tax=Tepiditoga spiralis TaxID=2108365 RepID=A0A7G1GC87_9BACT|nr:cell division protein FtsZ [Tepiditoga spiralis]BBE31929.1 cell division protein FtsZ [Tepiditoga spiralis]